MELIQWKDEMYSIKPEPYAYVETMVSGSLSVKQTLLIAGLNPLNARTRVQNSETHPRPYEQ